MPSTFDYLDLAHPADDDLSARAASLRSRAAVQAGDREGWLSLFAKDAVVQDPVGISPFDEAGDGHHGREQIAAFYDNVIAPNQIGMAIVSSAAGGDEVANYMTLTTTLPDGSSVAGEIVAIYKVGEDGKILSLRAFWEMDQLRFSPPAG